MVCSQARRMLGITCGIALLAANAAQAGPGYSTTGFIAKGPVNAQLIAAYAKLNAAPIMKDRKSRGLLLSNVADGADPATHSLVVVFPSETYAEAFTEKLLADPAWAEWQNTLAQLGTVFTSSLRVQTVRSWGDISDADAVWETHAFRVRDWPAFLAANERNMQTTPGKAFPGQVHITVTSAAGIAPVNGAIVVGFASMAEREAWRDKYAQNAEWLAYLGDLERSAEFLGTTLGRTLAAHGASLKSTLGR